MKINKFKSLKVMKTKSILLLALLFMTINVSVYYVTEINVKQIIGMAFTEDLNSLTTHYKVLLEAQKNIATAAYKSTIHMDRVLEIMSEAKSASKERKEELRKELHRLLASRYSILQEQGVLQYQFVLPTNEVFYGAQKPNKFGDDITGIRTDFEYTNRTKKSIRGFIQGKISHGFRNIFPLFDQKNNYLGAMEVSFSSDSFQCYLNNISGIHSHFIVDKKIFSAKTWNRDDLILKYRQSSESKNYMLNIGDTLTKETSINEKYDYFASVRKEIDSKIMLGKEFATYVKNQNNHFNVISFLPISNINNKVVAWIVSYEKSPMIKTALFNTLVIRVVFFLLSLLIIYFIVKQMYSNFDMLEKSNRIEELNTTLEEQIKSITSSQKRFETIFESGMDGIAIIDLESNFLLVNAAYEKMLEMTKEEFYKTSCIAMTTPDMIEESKRVLGEMLVQGYYKGYEKKCTANSGKIIDVRMDIVAMPDKKTILLIVKDITQYNVDKKEKELQSQQMLQQSRLAQMGEMISMIAHQWRQPLNAISLTTSNLQIKLMMDDVNHEFFTQEIKLIDSYSQHLSKTIDDFRSFFKDNKNKETTTLDYIVNSTLEIVKVSVENKNIKIVTDLNCHVEFETYPNEVKQVVLNIIKNAEDVLLEKEVKNPTITIQTICSSNETSKQLIIKDNAGGIPEDIIDKIFDPYFSTKLEKDGTGLGLYMSKTIIEDHCAGKLRVANDEDGAVFRIEFDVEQKKKGAIDERIKKV